jgi:hypothetical protein
VDEERVSGRYPNGTDGDAMADNILDNLRPMPLNGDFTFEERPGGFEVWYSDRIANDHRELVEESADWLEGQPGIENLGQIDYKILIADGPLTEDLRRGLVAWWAERIDDLDVG